MSTDPLLVTFRESLGMAGDNIHVTFTPEVKGGTSPYRYEWNFGDGNGRSTAQNAVYAYLLSRNEKIMQVTLQVTDASEKTTTAINSIVLPSKPLPFGLDKNALRSLEITSAMTAIAIALLSIFMTIYPNPVGVTLTAGALGGFLHEYVQSKGTVLFIAKKEDGLYLGSITGLILGAVAGLFVLEGNINNTQMVPVFLESILAGLALKGVSEAATGSPKEPEDNFEIIAAAHTSGKINIQIRNKMLHDLELQQVIITDSDQAMHTEQVPSQSRKVTAKQIIGFDIPVKVLKGPTIKITVISRNSAKEIQSIPL